MFSKIFPRENLGRVKVPSLAIRFAEASSFRRGFLLGMEIDNPNPNNRCQRFRGWHPGFSSWFLLGKISKLFFYSKRLFYIWILKQTHHET